MDNTITHKHRVQFMTIKSSFMHHYLSLLGFYSPQHFTKHSNLNPYNPSRQVLEETIHKVQCRK